MTEFERIKQMYHQLHVLGEHNVRYVTRWQRARKAIKAAMENIPQNEERLLRSLKLSADALTIMQSMEDNPPLKKIALDRMNGEPVWVVSYNHDGRWGIVNVSDESVELITENGIEQEYWFDGRYIFRYKKEIADYTQYMITQGIEDV